MIYYFELNIHDMQALELMLRQVMVTDINKLKTYNVGAVACNEILKGIVKRIATKLENTERKQVKVKLRYFEMRVLVEVIKVTPYTNEYQLSVKRQVLFALDKHAKQLIV